MRRYLILGLLLILAGFFLQLPTIKPVVKIVFLFPCQVIQRTVNGIGDFFSFLYQAKYLSEENKLLRKQLNEAETQNSIYLAKISELERLRKYESASSNLLLSNVIAREPSNWFKTLIIDKGSESGIRVNMPVILPEGIVGRIIEVNKGFSTVLLAVDNGSKIAAIVAETRELGIVEGMDKFLLISFFSNKIDAKPEDTVLTSGLGGVFPKGLTLGKITDVKKDGLVAKAEVQPAVNFNKIEEVLILIK